MSDQNEGVTPMGFFKGAPRFVQGIVYLLCVPTLVATLSIMLLQFALQIPFGPLAQEAITKYLNDRDQVMLEALQANRDEIIQAVTEKLSDRLDQTDTAIAGIADRLDQAEGHIASIDSRVSKLEGHIGNMTARLNSVEGVSVGNQARIDELYGWTCGPIMVDRDPANDPGWCQ